MLPFTKLAHDVAHNQLPAFSLIIPNVTDDMHNGTVAQGDAWLNANIVPLLNSPALGSNGVVFVVFDEAGESDRTGGGGHVDVLALGPAVTGG